MIFAMKVNMNNLETLWQDKKIVFVLGSGGVGKTTLSIALALHAVSIGKKVALISIDPAKRLASALGIPLSGALKKIDLDEPLFNKGSLSALMIDQEMVFSQMVTRFSSSKKKAAEIKNHPLYQMVIHKLAGAVEYMAMVKLYDVVNLGEHDLIIVDTPPDNHTVKFLKNPNLLENFLAQGALDWFNKILNLGQKGPLKFFFAKSQRIMGDMAQILGFSTLVKFSEFLYLIKDVIIGFSDYGTHLKSIIYDKKTAFFSVLTPQFMHFRRHQDLGAELAKMGLKWDGIIVNRLLAKNIESDIMRWSEDSSEDRPSELLVNDAPEDVMLSRYQGQKAVLALIRAQSHVHAKFRVVEVREHEADLATAQGREIFVQEIS